MIVVQLLQDEQGGILVLFGLGVTVLVLFASFVVDVGNWFEHRRHLQMQADAGALAAAQEFGVIDPDGCGASANAAVEQTARNYSGDVYNAQIGDTPPGRVHFALNSSTWPPDQTSPVDETVVAAPPCEAKMVDVKLAETELPWYFRVAHVPYINAHARVSILQQHAGVGLLPVGVPDVNPERVRVELVDEANGGATIGGTDLERVGASGGNVIWDNESAPLPVSIDSPRIGVRVILSGGASTTCGEPLVECYDLESSNGIVFIRGWSGDALSAGGPPKARDVTLVGGSCPDPYFSSEGASCTIGVRAEVDANITPADLKLTARAGGTDYALTYDAGTGVWETAPSIPVGPGAGPLPVELEWEQTTGSVNGNTCTTTGGNKCKGTFGTVQRSFGATEARSGPVALAQVWEGGALFANSFERCTAEQPDCSHQLVFRIGVKGNLENARDESDPVVALRVTGGSQNQSLDCDPDVPNLRDEIAFGCAPLYAKNTGTVCPGSNPDLWASPQPWTCVGIQTGTAVNQVAAGMNLRVFGDAKATSCTSPNNWDQFDEGGIPSSDPRIIQVFLTPFGSFSGSGSGTVEVSNFATFYATGWAGQGGGFANPCEGQGDDPAPNGHIVGHFIKYVSVLNEGGGSDEPCDFNAFGACVAVLTE